MNIMDKGYHYNTYMYDSSNIPLAECVSVLPHCGAHVLIKLTVVFVNSILSWFESQYCSYLVKCGISSDLFLYFEHLFTGHVSDKVHIYIKMSFQIVS